MGGSASDIPLLVGMAMDGLHWMVGIWDEIVLGR
jgi:hypothetical protein